MARHSHPDFRITQPQLLLLASKGRKFDERTLEMLECVCVNGESQQVVCERYGVPPQVISRARTSLIKRMHKMEEEGYLVRTVKIHPSLEVKLNALIEKSDEMMKSQNG